MFERQQSTYKYVGKPIQQYAQAVDTLNKRYDDAIQQKSVIDTAVASLPAGNENERRVLQTIGGELKSSIDKYVQGGDYGNMDIIARNLATSFASDPRVAAVSANAEKIKEAQKLKERAEFEGKRIYTSHKKVTDDKGRVSYIPEADYDDTSFSSVGPDGQIRDFKNPYQMGLDYGDKMRSLIGTIKADGSSSVGNVDLRTTGLTTEEIQLLKNTYLQKNSFSGVSRDKVEKLVNALLPAYLETDEGKQDLITLETGQRGVATPSVKIGGREYKGAMADIASRMVGVASPQIGMTTDSQLIGMPQKKAAGSDLGFGDINLNQLYESPTVTNIFGRKDNKIDGELASRMKLNNYDASGHELVFQFAGANGKNQPMIIGTGTKALNDWNLVQDGKTNKKMVDGKHYLHMEGFVTEGQIKNLIASYGGDKSKALQALKDAGVIEKTSTIVKDPNSNAQSAGYRVRGWMRVPETEDFIINRDAAAIGTTTEDVRISSKVNHQLLNSLKQTRDRLSGAYSQVAADLSANPNNPELQKIIQVMSEKLGKFDDNYFNSNRTTQTMYGTLAELQDVYQQVVSWYQKKATSQ